MRYGVILPNMGEGCDARGLAGLAAAAEEAGWDGVFVWDSVYIPGEGATYDPWITLAAIALSTRRVRIGTMITALARRRPWKVARETVTLDHLCQGRLTLPVGLGSLGDGAFSRVGEETDRHVRARRLDESLAILTGLWSGQPFSYRGEHYQVQEMTFLPAPLQTPRIPIWVVGTWPRPASMRRALRYDGVLAAKMDAGGSFVELTPDDVREMAATIAEQRTGTTPFDIVLEGHTPGDDAERAAGMVRPFAEAGATWWLDNVWRTSGGLEGMRLRIRQGPPVAKVGRPQ